MKKIVLVLAILSLISCKSDMSDLDKYFADAKNIPAQQIEPLPEIDSPEVFIYEAEEFRDPFSNDLAVTEEQDIKPVIAKDGIGPNTNRRKEMLETYPLDSLYMVGTYMQDGSYWGLIEDPEGGVNRVAVSQHLGQNYGEIIKIEEDQITVSEWLSDGLGGWTKREASIALREE